MMTNEQQSGRISIGAMWRGIDDSSIEEVYYFLYHKLMPNDYILPSVMRIEYVEPSILKYIKTELKATLVCGSDYFPSSKPKPRTEDEAFEDSVIEQERTYLFSLQPPDCKFPILLRLASERKKFDFTACCFDSEALAKVAKPIAKKFAFKSDYKNQLMFGILYPEGNRLTIRELPLDDAHVKEMNLELNYGPEFLHHHERVMSKLSNNKRGVFIFHGMTGTGKTTYIKRLAYLFGGKRMFIFIPATHLDTLVSPALLPVLLDHQNSILVLEDAEKAVVSREQQLGNESMVSTLLNIGDGILGSMLNLSLMVTFNTKKEKIDSALLRKGRLLYEYEFKSLSVMDAQKLADSLGQKEKITAPMTIADVYNRTESTGHTEEESRKIGFAA